MSVYVDDMRARFGRLVMCHMMADSTGELIGMARAIGVDTKWIQSAGTDREHFDIALSKRALAVKAGAIETTQRDLAKRRIERRRVAAPPPSAPAPEQEGTE
jgi:hypothetical protein